MTSLEMILLFRRAATFRPLTDTDPLCYFVGLQNEADL